MRQARRKPIHKHIVTNRIGKYLLPQQITIDICRDENYFLLDTQIFTHFEWCTFDFLYEWEQHLEQHIEWLYQDYANIDGPRTQKFIQLQQKIKTIKIIGSVA